MIYIFGSLESMEQVMDCTCSCNLGKPDVYRVGYMDGYLFTKYQNR